LGNATVNDNRELASLGSASPPEKKCTAELPTHDVRGRQIGTFHAKAWDVPPKEVRAQPSDPKGDLQASGIEGKREEVGRHARILIWEGKALTLVGEMLRQPSHASPGLMQLFFEGQLRV
jgi:hypothetical protein